MYALHTFVNVQPSRHGRYRMLQKIQSLAYTCVVLEYALVTRSEYPVLLVTYHFVIRVMRPLPSIVPLLVNHALSSAE